MDRMVRICVWFCGMLGVKYVVCAAVDARNGVLTHCAFILGGISDYDETIVSPDDR